MLIAAAATAWSRLCYPARSRRCQLLIAWFFLDEAIEHAGAGSPTPGVITLNRVAVLKQRGIPAKRMISYEVGNRSVDLFTGASAHVPGATYFELPPNGMAAVGCVRLIGDGII